MNAAVLLAVLVGVCALLSTSTAIPKGESCQGRCGESFRRGRACECDSACERFGTCCFDFQTHCATPRSERKSEERWMSSQPVNSESEETITDSSSPPSPYWSFPALEDPRRFTPYKESPVTSDLSPLTPGPHPLINSSSGPGSSAQSNNLSSVIEALLTAPDASLPSQGGPSAGTNGSMSPSSPGDPMNIHITLSSPKASGSKPEPGTLEQLAQALAGSKPVPGILDQLVQALERAAASQASTPAPSSLPDLCSNQPINGLTALINGSIMVFKGEFFWLVDPSTRRPGPARSISDHLGVPTPIDAVFSRCNCQGKTYIIKGDQYWRLNGGVVEPGYPRSLSSGFSGLRGPITAALAIPATRKRPEAAYFFKKGGKMQKYTFPTGSGPSCNRKSPTRSRTTRQTEGRLGLEINIQVSLKGLPAPVTSALSLPNPRKSDGYDYFLFSGPLFFNIKISGDLPSLVKPPSKAVARETSPNQNSVSSWLNCA